MRWGEECERGIEFGEETERGEKDGKRNLLIIETQHAVTTFYTMFT